MNLPTSGKAEPHQGDAPNHGVTIDLPEPGDKIWTYAHWDAALLEGSHKAALERLKIVLSEHPDAKVSIERTTLAGLSAYTIRFTYADTQPMTEEVIVAYRKPKDDSKDTGIIYEIGLKCNRYSYKVNAGIFESFVGTFQQTEK